MKAAIALLADYAAHNYARRVVFELEQKYRIDFLASHLPAHISLKQPFSFESMERLEGYFDSLAAQIIPFRISLDEIYYTEWGGYGILGLNVKETATLRRLHNRLNRELCELFDDTSAPHDGSGYHFHMTIELGRVEKVNPYRSYFDTLENKKAHFAFMAKEVALFYYTGEDHRSFMNYKVLPLTGSGTRRYRKPTSG
jgi:2'-5' RNA ligase